MPVPPLDMEQVDNSRYKPRELTLGLEKSPLGLRGSMGLDYGMS